MQAGSGPHSAGLERAHEASDGTAGIHVNMPATVSAVAKALQAGDPAPAGLSLEHLAHLDAAPRQLLVAFARRGVIVVRESQIWEEGGSVSAGLAVSAGPCVVMFYRSIPLGAGDLRP